MPNLVLSTRITGADVGIRKTQAFSPAAIKAIQEAAQARAQITVQRFKREMDAEWGSAWATGLLAAGVTFKTSINTDGVDVKFYIPNRQELKFVTALFGGHFKSFPVGPFVIKPVNGKSLSIPLVGRARQFIRGEKGQFAGSRAGSEDFPGRIAVKAVLWGRKTGGFARDVIAEVAEQEGAIFVEDVRNAVADVIARL